MITDEVGIKLKYPTLDGAGQLSDLDMTNLDVVFDYVTESIDYIFDAEKVYEENTKQEVKDFLENLSQAQFDLVMSFWSTMPKLEHTVEYVCEACGSKESFKIEGLQGFFA